MSFAPSSNKETTDSAQNEMDCEETKILRSYWRQNLTLVGFLLSIWAFAGLGCGVVFADTLNSYYLPGTGYPLGFWFAQQGSIIVFVFLILAYALGMNVIDRKHNKVRAGMKAHQK